MSENPFPSDFSGRLDHLFADRGVTNAEVADAVNAATGAKVLSESYLSMLRRGVRRNISAEKLAKIAAFFNVDVSYFTSPVKTDDLEQGLFDALADPRVRALVVTAARLPDESLETLLRTAALFKQAADARVSIPAQPDGDGR